MIPGPWHPHLLKLRTLDTSLSTYYTVTRVTSTPPKVFLPLPRQAGATFLGTLDGTGDQTQEASLPSFLGFTVLPASHLFFLVAPPLNPAPESPRQPWPQAELHSLPNTPGQWVLAGCSLCLECLSLGSLTPRPLISLPKCLFLHIPTVPRLSLGYPSLCRFLGSHLPLGAHLASSFQSGWWLPCGWSPTRHGLESSSTV